MTMLFAQQLTQSTADDARDYFTGTVRTQGRSFESALPPGNYRVVDGLLCRVVDGVPPGLMGTDSRSLGEPPRKP